MNKQRNEKRLDELISQTINTEKPRFDAEKWKQKYPDEFQTLLSRAAKGDSARQPSILKVILKSPLTKLAATLTVSMAPPLCKLYGHEVRNETALNALRAAVEVYIVKAKTGQLPDELPAGLPKDLFSGKDFRYEKTKDGFILRCRGKDLEKDEIHQYEFKVKK